MNQGLDTLVNHLASLFERKREKRQATIVGVERSEQSGRQGYVTAEIQRGQNSSYIQKIYVGDAASFTVGDQYWIRGSGNPVDPDWQFGEAIKSRNPTKGADVDKPVIVLTIPVATNPDDGFSNPVGVGTEQDLDANTGANAEPQAIARIYYRTIVPGTHSVYDPSTYVTHVVPQVRRVIDENWRTMPAVAVWPSAAKRLRLTAGIDDNDLVAAVSDDDGVPGDDWPIGHYVYWQIDGEILLAKVAIDGTMTILARGVEGTTAVAHLANAAILLLTGMAVLTGLDPGVNHEVRVSAQTGHNQVGPPSVSVAFVTWRRTSIPGLTGAQYLVEMRSNGFHLEWTRPTDPDTSNPHTGRLSYRIYRNTTNAINGDEKIVAEGITGFSTDIAATLWDVPATQADAYWFGIEPYDSFGNEGTILWEKDDTPPPAASFSSWWITPMDLAIRVSYSAIDDSSNVTSDPGFLQFVLYRATSTAGANETAIGVFGGPNDSSASTNYEPPLDRAYYFQIASMDFAGNVSPRTNTDSYWKIGLPNVFVSVGVRNGNFQVPNPRMRTVTDAAITSAATTLTSASAGFTDADYGTLVKITGAASGGATYYGAITAVTNGTTVTVTPAAGATVTGATAVIGNFPNDWRLAAGFPNDASYPGTDTSKIPATWVIAYESTGGIAGNRVLHITIPAGNWTTGYALVIAQKVVQPYARTHVGATAGVSVKVVNAGTSAGVGLWIVNQIYDDDFGQTPQTPELSDSAFIVISEDGAWHRQDLLYDDDRQWGNLYTGTTQRFAIGITAVGNSSGAVDVYIDDITNAYQ